MSNPVFLLAFAVYPHGLVLTPPSSPEHEEEAPSPTYSPTPAYDPMEIDDYSPTSPRYEPTQEELEQLLAPTAEYGSFLPPTQGTKRKAEDEHPEQPPAKRQR